MVEAGLFLLLNVLIYSSVIKQEFVENTNTIKLISLKAGIMETVYWTANSILNNLFRMYDISGLNAES